MVATIGEVPEFTGINAAISPVPEAFNPIPGVSLVQE